jgi:hypothetical protein
MQGKLKLWNPENFQSKKKNVGLKNPSMKKSEVITRIKI